MEVVISFNKQSVLSSVKEITGYTGKTLGEGIDIIAVTDDESNIMDTLLDQALTDLLAKISRYMPVYSGDTIRIELPKTFDQKALPLLNKGIEDLITNDACSAWFHIARLEGDSKKYSEMAFNSYQNVIKLLCARVKPV